MRRLGRIPKAWPLYLNRANVFVHQRRFDLAIQDLNTVLRLRPGVLLVQVLRGQIYEHLGDYSHALADYDRVVSITSSLPLKCAFAQNSRAWLRATCPGASFWNGKQAVADAKSACNETSWSEVAYIDTLAAANAEAGDFDSAIQFEQRAIKGRARKRGLPKTLSADAPLANANSLVTSAGSLPTRVTSLGGPTWTKQLACQKIWRD